MEIGEKEVEWEEERRVKNEGKAMDFWESETEEGLRQQGRAAAEEEEKKKKKKEKEENLIHRFICVFSSVFWVNYDHMYMASIYLAWDQAILSLSL